MGEVTNLYVAVEGVEEPLVAKVTGTSGHRRGERAAFDAPVADMHLFDAKGRSFHHRH